MIARRTKSLDGGKCKESDVTIWHWSIHDRSSTYFIASDSSVTSRASGASSFVKIEIDLSTNFGKDNLSNDIPLERS